MFKNCFLIKLINLVLLEKWLGEYEKDILCNFLTSLKG